MTLVDVHFGAGNIGKGFIGETLADNNFEIKFVDLNETIIDELNKRNGYDIQIAAPNGKEIHVKNVSGINNKKNPQKVIEAIQNADLVTTAIGPNILKFIAPLIDDGLKARMDAGNDKKMDVIACENMIGGSSKLKEYVYDNLDEETAEFVSNYIGFPNAAVDRIVPQQEHDDPLLVSVEPFKEWVVDESQMKNPDIKLKGVEYAADLEPYIERKLFSVNTGHATVAYNGNYVGYKTIDEAVQDESIVEKLKNTLQETGNLLIDKWNFDKKELTDYQNKIVNRFKNPYISDSISRVGRTPIRKLGYNERFIRPIRECNERGLDYKTMMSTVGKIYTFDVPTDKESVELQQMLKNDNLEDVVKKTTGLKDTKLLNEVIESAKKAINDESAK